MPDSSTRSIPPPDGFQHIQKVLIANRGEIACRIIRSLQQLQLTSVIIYTKADRGSLHVRLADEVWVLPGTDGTGYLDQEAILGIARKAGVQAIVPGYGESFRVRSGINRDSPGKKTESRSMHVLYETSWDADHGRSFVSLCRLLIRKRGVCGKGRTGGTCLGGAFVLGHQIFWVETYRQGVGD
jgi:hypothetical protein